MSDTIDITNPPDVTDGYTVVVTRGPMASPPVWAIIAAADAARVSPCQKSKRGVVAYRLYDHKDADKHYAAPGHPHWFGFNGPPLRRGIDGGFMMHTDKGACDGSAACRSVCGQRCVHAEQRCIIGSAFAIEPAYNRVLVHVKVTDKRVVAGKGPSCAECSKLVSDSGVEGIWLFEDRGGDPPVWRYYNCFEFHEQTLRNLGIYQPPL